MGLLLGVGTGEAMGRKISGCLCVYSTQCVCERERESDIKQVVLNDFKIDFYKKGIFFFLLVKKSIANFRDHFVELNIFVRCKSKTDF